MISESRSKERILVLSPHPDDAELSAGGALNKFCNQQKEVWYVVFMGVRGQELE